GVVARDQAEDLALAVVDLDVAAGRTAVAHRRRGVELPRAKGEAEVLRGEGADRADVDGVERVRVVEHRARRGPELLVITPAAHLELVLTGDLVADPDAAGAQD